MRGSARLARQRRVAQNQPQVVEIEVLLLSNFAFNAGLTIEQAQCILVQSPDWRYPELYCGRECGRQPHVTVDGAWEGRQMLWCSHCKTADLWV